MLRLILSILLALLSMLVLFKAPTNFLWRVSVAVTEFPYLFMAASFILCAFCFRAEKYKLLSLSLSSISFIIFCLPIVQAYMLGASLPAKLGAVAASKTSENELPKPFSMVNMFTGIGSGQVKPKAMVYKSLPGRNLSLDFYPAASGAAAPCIIVIHGGSWSEGDSKQLPALNSYLANRNYNVAAINYRLAPEFKSPAPVEDTRDAIRYLTQHADELKIDTSNFILLGRSAGGQIALVAAYSLHLPNVKGVISFYGPADMVWGAQVKTNKLVLNTDKVFSDYLGGLFKSVPQKYYESSSCEYVNPSSTPTLIIHGEHDPMVAFEHALHLEKKLQESHVSYFFLDIPWATHGCDYNINGPSGQITTYTVERFIQSAITGSWKK